MQNDQRCAESKTNEEMVACPTRRSLRAAGRRQIFCGAPATADPDRMEAMGRTLCAESLRIPAAVGSDGIEPRLACARRDLVLATVLDSSSNPGGTNPAKKNSGKTTVWNPALFAGGYQAEMFAVSLGPVAFVSVPGELLCETDLTGGIRVLVTVSRSACMPCACASNHIACAERERDLKTKAKPLVSFSDLWEPTSDGMIYDRFCSRFLRRGSANPDKTNAAVVGSGTTVSPNTVHLSGMYSSTD